MATDVCSDDDLAACLRVLGALATGDGGVSGAFQDRRFKPLRVALQPYLEELRGRLYYGKQPHEVSEGKASQRRRAALQQQERAHDREAVEKTVMRSRRRQMLDALAHGEGVPDGAVDGWTGAESAPRSALLLHAESGAESTLLLDSSSPVELKSLNIQQAAQCALLPEGGHTSADDQETAAEGGPAKAECAAGAAGAAESQSELRAAAERSADPSAAEACVVGAGASESAAVAILQEAGGALALSTLCERLYEIAETGWAHRAAVKACGGSKRWARRCSRLEIERPAADAKGKGNERVVLIGSHWMSGAAVTSSHGDAAAHPLVAARARALGASEAPSAASATLLGSGRVCYTCKLRFKVLDAFYAQLCPSCATLNRAKRDQSAEMSGRVALVTGCRVKIGFHVCLKLLRAGATVIGTSRFPGDAAERFAAEPDFESWAERLQLVGLDLRHISMLESFCAQLTARLERLDVLINNACQTVRRPAAYYAHLIPGEMQLSCERDARVAALLRANDEIMLGCSAGSGGGSSGGSSGCSGSCSSGGEIEALGAALGTEAQEPPVVAVGEGRVVAGGGADRASAPIARAGPGAVPSALWSQLPLWPGGDAGSAPSEALPVGRVDVNGQQLDLRRENSWLLKLHQASPPPSHFLHLPNSFFWPIYEGH